jgi:hypothetical protein
MLAVPQSAHSVAVARIHSQVKSAHTLDGDDFPAQEPGDCFIKRRAGYAF